MIRSLGTHVRWTSGRGKKRSERIGQIVRILPPGAIPSPDEVKVRSLPRDHVSYLIRSDGRLWWPPVSLLQFESGPSIRDVLLSMRKAIVNDRQDWSTHHANAWLFGILIGWGDYFDEIADKNQWSSETRTMLTLYGEVARNIMH